MKVVILGLSITSSVANGHAATYRTLVNELAQRGHDVVFLERNLPWHAECRDIPRSRFGRVEIYESAAELQHIHAEEVRHADCVILGSGIPEGAGVSDWVMSETRGVTAFYDIETSSLKFAGADEAVTLYYGGRPAALLSKNRSVPLGPRQPGKLRPRPTISVRRTHVRYSSTVVRGTVRCRRTALSVEVGVARKCDQNCASGMEGSPKFL